jgi:hypothetical protein
MEILVKDGSRLIKALLALRKPFQENLIKSLLEPIIRSHMCENGILAPLEGFKQFDVI